MDHVDTCKECGSKELTWFTSLQNNGSAVDGRLKLNEVGCIFVLGCDECSETLQIVPADLVASVMTENLR
jgi:hypothetical protein